MYFIKLHKIVGNGDRVLWGCERNLNKDREGKEERKNDQEVIHPCINSQMCEIVTYYKHN